MNHLPCATKSLPEGLATRRQCMGLGIGLAGCIVAPWAQAAQPLLQDEVWLDAARNREVPVLVRWPVAAPQGIVIFSHGQGGKRSGADVWGLAWAQAGLLVLHLQHPGSDAAAVRGAGALNKAMAPEQLMARVGDVKFAIDELQRRRSTHSDRWAELPLGRIALAGHSFGARTVQAVAGQAYPKASWSGQDPRVQAFIAMSPALGKDATATQAREDARAMKRPMLLISGSLDGEVLNNGETVESRRMVYDILPNGAKALLWLQGADHLTFAGVSKQIASNFLIRREASTLALEAGHHRAVAATSAAWLKEQMLSQPMGAPVGLAPGDVWLRG
jgi:predicted dienelactone hydrolase